MKFFDSSRRGFTIIEMMVVIAIIGILSSIVLASMSQARKQARDDARVADIEQLALAMRLYVEQNGALIDCDGGLKIDGQTAPANPTPPGCPDEPTIIPFLVSYFGGQVIADPKGPGDGRYYYYFDGVHTCSGMVTKSIVFAHDLETRDSNKANVCSPGSAGGGFNEYEPYVKGLPFVTWSP